MTRVEQHATGRLAPCRYQNKDRRNVAVSKTNPMSKLYNRLSKVGLTRHYIRNMVLPSWWDDEIAENPSGFAQGILLVARHLGLDLTSLQNEGGPVRLREFGSCKYKKRADVEENELAMCRMMATRAAQLAAEAMELPLREIPDSASEIRHSILDQGARWVGLTELLNYCWSMGIPVLHLDHFPNNARRPDGFAARINGRPVVVLCSGKKQLAWQLFLLAHELGHICRGHIAHDEALIDDRVDEGSEDAEEVEANSFATEILTGLPLIRVLFDAGRSNLLP